MNVHRTDLPVLLEPLTGREVEVVSALACGMNNQLIGQRLGISAETVKTHLVNAMGKLGANDRTQLAVLAMAYGLVDPFAK